MIKTNKTQILLSLASLGLVLTTDLAHASPYNLECPEKFDYETARAKYLDLEKGVYQIPKYATDRFTINRIKVEFPKKGERRRFMRMASSATQQCSRAGIENPDKSKSYLILGAAPTDANKTLLTLLNFHKNGDHLGAFTVSNEFKSSIESVPLRTELHPSKLLGLFSLGKVEIPFSFKCEQTEFKRFILCVKWADPQYTGYDEYYLYKEVVYEP